MNYNYMAATRRGKLLLLISITLFILLPLNIFLANMFGFPDAQSLSLKNNAWAYTIIDEDTPLILGDLWKDSEVKNNWLSLSEIGNSLGDNNSRIVIYKTELPAVEINEGSMLFQTNDQSFKIYVNKKLIYSYGSFDEFDYRKSPGSPVHIIELPVNYQSNELIIAMKTIATNRLGIVRAIEIDSKSNHVLYLFRSNIKNFILSNLNLIFGLICIFFSFAVRSGRKASLSLGISFSIVGIWSISENPLSQILYFNPSLWYYLAIISFYLIPISIYNFLKHISRTSKHIYNILIRLHIVFFITSLSLDLTGLAPFILSLPFYYLIMGISFIISMRLGIKSYFRGSTIALLYTLGYLILGAAAIYDVLGWYFEIIKWKTYATLWGMFLFEVLLLIALILHLRNMQERILLYRDRIKVSYTKLKEKDREIDKVIEQDKIKTEFFANISHELRTPLNIIYSTVQLIRMFYSNGKIISNEINLDKYTGIMNQNCNRLMKLVDNIIDITKIESGFYKLSHRKVNIIKIINDIVLSIEEFANNKAIKLVFNSKIDARDIVCDPDAIERIILNLLSNAIKFSKEGSYIYVVIKEANDKLLIEVEDTGIGIPQDMKDVIFDRFAQVDKSFTRQNEGSGIGLAIVRSLVEMHGGTITLESELHKGSKFIIALPYNYDHIDAINEPCDEMNAAKREKVSIEFSDL